MVTKVVTLVSEVVTMVIEVFFLQLHVSLDALCHFNVEEYFMVMSFTYARFPSEMLMGSLVK